MIELIGQIFNNRNFNMVVPAFAVAFIIVAYKNPDEPIYTIGAIAFSIITVFIIINLIVSWHRQHKYKKKLRRRTKKRTDDVMKNVRLRPYMHMKCWAMIIRIC